MPRAALASLMVLAIACGRYKFHDRPDADDIIDATPDAPFGPFGSPTPLTSLGSSAYDDDVTLTGDLLEIYFATTRVDPMGDVWFATRATTSDPWSAPAPVPNINSADEDQSIGIAADGLTIYFASRRPGGPTGSNIWMSTRASRTSGWTTPTLAAELSSPLDDFEAQPDPSNLRLVMYRHLGGVDRALFETRRASVDDPWDPPVQITSLDAPESERSPHLTDNGLAIYFASDRASGMTDLHDLFVALRPTVDAPFGTPQLLDTLSMQSSDDDDPWVSPDGHTIFFESSRGGNAELWTATR